jgi:hypothetical protein
MITATSFIGGRFLETAGPIINVSLLAGSSALFAEALAAALIRHGRLEAVEMPLVVIAIAVSLRRRCRCLPAPFARLGSFCDR